MRALLFSVFICSILCSCATGVLSELKESNAKLKPYYEKMKSNIRTIDKYDASEIVDLYHSKVLDISPDDDIIKLIDRFGGLAYEKKYSTGYLWHRKIICKANLHLLMEDNLLIGIEFAMPSNYFISYKDLTSYETIDELIEKIGNPVRIYLQDDQPLTNFEWLISGHIIDIQTYGKDIYPTWFRYYF